MRVWHPPQRHASKRAFPLYQTSNLVFPSVCRPSIPYTLQTLDTVYDILGGDACVAQHAETVERAVNVCRVDGCHLAFFQPAFAVLLCAMTFRCTGRLLASYRPGRGSLRKQVCLNLVSSRLRGLSRSLRKRNTEPATCIPPTHTYAHTDTAEELEERQ